MPHVPTKPELLRWIADNPTATSKREIAKAFGIKGAARIDLKRLLKELEAEGHLTKAKKTYRDPESLPPVSVLVVQAPDENGDMFARPLNWHGNTAEPRVSLVLKSSDPALGPRDRVLARLTEVHAPTHRYEGHLIRRLPKQSRRVLGLYRQTAEGGRIVPVDKGADVAWRVPAGETGTARDGELVEAEQIGPKGRLGLPVARIVARLGDPSAPKSVSLIAVHEHGIPDSFPTPVLAAAEQMVPADMAGRTDLTDLPFVTIDPVDARDHDDAVWAEPHKGGHRLWVAIADVAHYVRPGSDLDREARLRGNSTYFPDRVVPMLPERLSGDLCSLHEGERRPVIVAEMTIDGEGVLLGTQFHRAMIKSRASLHYGAVQAAQDGAPDAVCTPWMKSVIAPLYDAYEALKRARVARQPLELDLPERRIELNDAGVVTSVAFRDRLDAHKLIEEFMVLANVAAAQVLEQKRQPLLYRVHEEPAADKIEALRDTVEASGFKLTKGQVLHTRALNRLLQQAAGTDEQELINLATLRAMTQAYYSPKNFSHFGLALRSYVHFTSPIRRYADLIVHRALITAHNWGADGLSAKDIEHVETTAQAISETERRSMAAERDTTDRYLAAYLSDRIGMDFSGRISGVQSFGLFVRLVETAADGLIPVRSLGREYFRFDRDAQTLTGSETGLELGIGQQVTVRLVEAAPITGGLLLELLNIEGKALRRKRNQSRSGRKLRKAPRGRKGK